MNSPAIVLSGGTATFNGNVTIDVSIHPTIPEAHNMITPTGEPMMRDQHDYLEVKHAEERYYHDHRGKTDTFYQISRHPKGRVLIINNEFRGTGWERRGSNKDQYDMVDMWDKIGCEVTKASDLTAKKLLDKVKEFASSNQEVDFCVLIIMSHGKEDDLVIGSQRAEVEVKQIVDAMMGSESFKNKPKLIFFQICRGTNIEYDQADAVPDQHFEDVKRVSNGVEVDAEQVTFKSGELGAGVSDTSENAWVLSLLHEILHNGRILGATNDEADNTAEDYISDTPDVLLAFATQPGYMSFRNNSSGSWLIQSIKEVFSKCAATDSVIKMLTKVQEKVRSHTAYAPGHPHDGGKETVDASDTFGKKRLMLFPGFPDPKPE